MLFLESCYISLDLIHFCSLALYELVDLNFVKQLSNTLGYGLALYELVDLNDRPNFEKKTIKGLALYELVDLNAIYLSSKERG